MKKLLLLILFVIITYLLLIQSQQTEEGFSSYDKNNNKKYNKKKAVLNCYLFYTDKCLHSKRFLDLSWKTISKKYSNNVVFTKIDCHDPNTKQLAKVFNVTSVPAIFMVKDMNNEELDKVEFLDERTPTNFENFIVKQINLNRKSESFENQDQPTGTSIPLNSMDDVEFYEFEDTINKKYEYSIKFKSNPIKNIIQKINEKETPGLKAWQGAYTVISEYIRQNAETLVDKNKLAYEIRNKISDWHLCDPDILNNVKQNITDPIDMDVNKALVYACGF
jgi:thioredoxin-related protein